MNTIHMESQDWALYIQQYKPSNIEECNAFVKDLLAYSERGNIEAMICEGRVKGCANRFEEVRSWPEYRKIITTAKQHQERIQEGFIRPNK
jgi:hypothetical protein